MMEASVLVSSNCILGEAAYWHFARGSFFWVDIQGKFVFEYNWIGKKINQWPVPARPSLVIEGDHERMLLAMQGGIAWLHLENGEIDWIKELEKDKPENRTNDGAVDSGGRLWIGTMELQCKKGCGSLYRIDTDITLHQKLSGLNIPNGIAWSDDNNRMYHVDTTNATVSSYIFEPVSGDIQFEKNIITVPPEMGAPDGMCMDEDGMLWIAHWGGYGVYRWDTNTGKLLSKIELPVPNVTSCTFGGENMDDLFITTAKDGLSEDELSNYPQSGNCFIVHTNVKGKKKHKFPVTVLNHEENAK